MEAERIEQAGAVLGGAVGVVGGVLAIATTLLLAPTPAAGLLLLFGLLLVPIGLVLAVAGRRRAGRPAAGDALLVRGAFGLHLLALLVTIALGAGWLLGGAGSVPIVAGCWGLAAAGYAALSYGWDRATATDVDAV